MFGRSESEQVRTLLRLIERQQQTIDNLSDRLMYLVGQTWMPPPVDLGPVEQLEKEPEYVSALDGLPPTEEEYGAQSD